MKYDDLLNVPFRWGGRDKSGMDCYGIVVECCKRAGTPISDPFRGLSASIPLEEAMRVRKQAINVIEADGPACGRIVAGEWKGESHVGYLVARDKVLHATQGGARVTPLIFFKSPLFYEVTPMEGE